MSRHHFGKSKTSASPEDVSNIFSSDRHYFLQGKTTTDYFVLMQGNKYLLGTRNHTVCFREDIGRIHPEENEQTVVEMAGFEI